MKRLFFLIGVAMMAVLCAVSAFACMPPFWGAEEEMPDDLRRLYRGRHAKRARKNSTSILFKGYERKTIA